MALLSSTQRVRNFIARTRAADEVRPRLIFGLDATASRQPTWNEASELQAEMFRAAGSAVDVKLAFYRGKECKSSKWVRDHDELMALMRKITCEGGFTQIGRILGLALRESEHHRIRALCFVGDAYEEDDADVMERAAALGKQSVPIFVFQEGNDSRAVEAFSQIAKLSDGIYARFDQGSGKQLAELLRTVGRFAASSDAAALSQARQSLLMLGR